MPFQKYNCHQDNSFTSSVINPVIKYFWDKLMSHCLCHLCPEPLRYLHNLYHRMTLLEFGLQQYLIVYNPRSNFLQSCLVLGFRASWKEKRCWKLNARALSFLKKVPHARQIEVTVTMELTAGWGPGFELGIPWTVSAFSSYISILNLWSSQL